MVFDVTPMKIIIVLLCKYILFMVVSFYKLFQFHNPYTFLKWYP